MNPAPGPLGDDVVSGSVDAQRGAAGSPQALQHHGVVLEGRLNPAIFQPRWLAAVGVIPMADADAVEDPLVSPGVATFRTPALSVQVTSERAVFRSRDGQATPQELARVVLHVFKELPHTPITSIDLVHEFDLPAATLRWEDAAENLLPAQNRETVLPGAELTSLTLECDGDDGSFVQVVIEPSDAEQDGVYVRVHREYVLEDAASGSAVQARGLLEQHWDSSLEEASTIIGRMADRES
jgi:hypothetical protein